MSTQRDVCGKCGTTRQARIKWWRELPRTSTREVAGRTLTFKKVGDDEDVRGLFFYCNHCKTGICGGCTIDLGMTAGCKVCLEELVYFDGTPQ